MLRRVVMVLAVALLTAGGLLWWLYEGDLQTAVQPVVHDAGSLAGGT
jgi:hypothetical protein